MFWPSQSSDFNFKLKILYLYAFCISRLLHILQIPSSYFEPYIFLKISLAQVFRVDEIFLSGILTNLIKVSCVLIFVLSLTYLFMSRLFKARGYRLAGNYISLPEVIDEIRHINISIP
jgi:hypothetical protein